MKTILIAAVAWVGNIRTFVDGDIFRETMIDLMAGDIADRLGYLKSRADLAAYLAGDQTFTGANLFQTSSGNGFEIAGTENVVISTVGVVQIAGAMTVAGASIHTNVVPGLGTSIASLNAYGKVRESGRVLLADANATIPGNVSHARVPQLTANRVYTLPAATSDDGDVVKLSRLRTADAFTVTLSDGVATLGVIPASEAGFIEAWNRGGTWVVTQYSNNITSRSTTV